MSQGADQDQNALFRFDNKGGSTINDILTDLQEYKASTERINNVLILRAAEIITVNQFKNLIKMLKSESDCGMAEKVIEELMKKL